MNENSIARFDFQGNERAIVKLFFFSDINQPLALLKFFFFRISNPTSLARVLM